MPEITEEDRLFQIKLQIRPLEHGIIAAFHAHLDGIKAQVDAAVRRVVDSVDVAKMAEASARAALDSAIKSTVGRAVDEAIGDSYIAARVSSIMRDGIRNRLDEMEDVGAAARIRRERDAEKKRATDNQTKEG